MANNKKKGAQPAAPTTKQENTKNTTVEVIDATSLKKMVSKTATTGLDANHQVDVLMGLKSYFHDDPNAAEKFGKDPVEQINRLTAIGFATAFVQEAFHGDSNWAATMRTSQLESLKSLAPMIGFTIDSKLLPAPDTEGNVVVPAKAIKVTQETKKKLENEKKIADSKPIIDPLKIENDDQLKNSLTFLLSDTAVKRPYERMLRATEFLRSYQLSNANKLDDAAKQEALSAINAKSTSDLLEEIRIKVGEVPFSTVGISHFIFSKTRDFDSPIFSHCLMRNASRNKKTGDTLSDEATAAIVRVLVNWTNAPQLEGYEKDVARAKIEIEKGTKKPDYLDVPMHNVDNCKHYVDLVLNCPTDFADNLLTNLESEDTNVKKAAQMTVSGILKAYYPDLNSTDDAGDKKDELLHDIQQRAGIITNLYRDPMSQDIRYSEANLLYTPTKKEEKAEESKN